MLRSKKSCRQSFPPDIFHKLLHNTTTWERWDASREDGTVNEDKITDDNMVSFNHYAFGSVGEFYYQYILGIIFISYELLYIIMKWPLQNDYLI